jgi:subtilisin family serine protease
MFDVKGLPMLRCTLLISVLVLALFGQLSPSLAQNDPPTAQPDQQLAQVSAAPSNYQQQPFAPGELLVGFHRDVVRSASLLADLQVELLDTLDLRGLDGKEGDAGVAGYRVRVPTGQEWTTLEKLQQDPAVAFVQPNWLVFAADRADEQVSAQPEAPFTVNDPDYAEKQWYLQRINASRAWALANATDGFGGVFSSIDVAVIDSGVDLDHSEFKNLLLAGQNYVSPGARIVDDCGHGTHVTGLIGALANNNIGIAGVAPKVRIDPRKVLYSNFGSCVGTVANVAAAIQDAVDNADAIINLSLELPASLCGASSDCDKLMKPAIQRAASKGILVIAASGNSSAPVAYPAAFPEVMAVAATTLDDKHASYSNTGSQVEISAPGGASAANNGIYSTWSKNVTCQNGKSAQNDFCSLAGTSMSAAIVTGAAALLWSVNPDQTASEVRQLLRTSATPISGSPAEVGSGRLDIYAALRALLPNDLQPLAANITEKVAVGSAPYTVTVRLENPSLQAVAWSATLLNGGNWLRAVNSANNPLSGSARYGEPAHVSLVISPTNLSPGLYAASLQVTATPARGEIKQTIGIQLTVDEAGHVYYLPNITGGSGIVSAPTTYHWETPITETERTVIGMRDESDVSVSLPFTFTLRNRGYRDLRIYSDGFVVFPSADTATTLPNQCMPNLVNPQQAIYAWWSDLDPGAELARVSTFQPALGRFVIEFNNVPVATTITPTYRVSFQIVLYSSGNIELNYQQTPNLHGAMLPVTIGVEARAGLFYNQVACKDTQSELGVLPESRQSLLFQAPEDLY